MNVQFPNVVQPNNTPRVLHVKDLAVQLSISLNSAYALLRANQIRHIRVGRTYRIPVEAVDEYLAQTG